jgi:hypothetical protein
MYIWHSGIDMADPREVKDRKEYVVACTVMPGVDLPPTAQPTGTAKQTDMCCNLCASPYRVGKQGG